MNLQDCHGKTIALRMEVQGRCRQLRGWATYLHDSTLGNCLAIEIDDPDAPGAEILLPEDQWQGQITPSDVEGCFALISLKKSSSWLEG